LFASHHNHCWFKLNALQTFQEGGNLLGVRVGWLLCYASSTNTMLVRSIVSSKSVHAFLNKVHPLHAFWGSGHRCRSYCTSEVAKEIKKDQPQSIKQHVAPNEDIVDVWICKPERVQLLAEELKSLHKTNARSQDSTPINVSFV
jgi:hypothetical protein